MLPEKLRDELFELLGALVDDRLTRSQSERLEEILLSSAEARQFYFDYLDMHSGLHRWQMEEDEVEPLDAFRGELEKIVDQRRPSRLSWAKAARYGAMVLLVVTLAFAARWLLVAGGGGQSTDNAKIAEERVTTVYRTQGCVWSAEQSEWRVGWRPTAGPISLEQGVAELAFDGGARLLLEGPTRGTILGRNRIALVWGRLVADTRHASQPFTVVTPNARLTSRDGEFGVELTPDGACQLHVFDGEVHREFTGAAPSSASSLSSIRSGKAQLWDDRVARAIPLAAARFVRRIAPPSSAEIDRRCLLARESFAGSLLEDRAELDTGWLGDWSVELGRDSLASLDDGLYRTVGSTSATSGALRAEGPLRMHRRLSTPISFQQDDLYYFACLVQVGEGSAEKEGQIRWTLTDSRKRNAKGGVAIGLAAGEQVIHARLDGRSVSRAFSLKAGETHLLVAKLVGGAQAQDQVFLRVFQPSEPVLPEEPRYWSLATESARCDGEFDTVSLQIDGTSSVTVDEFRLATTWQGAVGPWIQGAAVPPEFTARADP